ncbi:MAG: hypothetical protein KJO82_00760 [Gammaproteobacteria bacterium]|nr:hypothetical protein [Gammaproteobacteria bacterium]
MSTPNDPDNAERQFAEQSKALFDESVESLDAATLSKLNQGRQAALAEVAGARAGTAWLRWAPAGGLAAAAVVAVIMMQGPGMDGVPSIPDTAATDLEILLGDDSLEMIEELEFYSWIDMAELDSPDNVG